MKTQKALFLLAALAAGTTVYADKVTLSQTPPAVQQAIRSRAGRHTVEDIDRDVKNGQTTYEASWKDNSGVQQELQVSDSGQILRDVPHGSRRTLNSTQTSAGAVTGSIAGFTAGQAAPLNWASETVQNKFKTMANGASIQNFQKGQFQGKTAFEGTFTQNGQSRTVILGEDGSLLASSPGAGASTSVTTTAPTTATTTAAAVAGFSNAQQAPMNWASETVQNKFKQMANGAPIENFQKGQFNGQTAYLGTYSQNGQSTTVVMGEDGTVLSTAPTAAGTAGTSVSGSLTQ
jgi:hypothetical protein